MLENKKNIALVRLDPHPYVIYWVDMDLYMMISDDDCAMYCMPPCVCWPFNPPKPAKLCFCLCWTCGRSTDPPRHLAACLSTSRPGAFLPSERPMVQRADVQVLIRSLLWRCESNCSWVPGDSTGLTFWRAYDSKPGDPPFSNRKSVLNKRLQPGVSTTGFSAAQHTSWGKLESSPYLGQIFAAAMAVDGCDIVFWPDQTMSYQCQLNCMAGWWFRFASLWSRLRGWLVESSSLTPAPQAYAGRRLKVTPWCDVTVGWGDQRGLTWTHVDIPMSSGNEILLVWEPLSSWQPRHPWGFSIILSKFHSECSESQPIDFHNSTPAYQVLWELELQEPDVDMADGPRTILFPITISFPPELFDFLGGFSNSKLLKKIFNFIPGHLLQ